MRIFNFNIRPTYLNIDGNELVFFPFFGLIRKAKWSKLVEAHVETTDKGPFSEDVFFLLKFENTTIRLEQCISGKLLTMLQALPGFNNEELIKAMSCSENAKFKVWSRT